MLLRRLTLVRVGTVLVGVFLVACRSEPTATTQPVQPSAAEAPRPVPGGPAPVASAPAPADVAARADAHFAALAARPIYTFSEAELGTYAALLHEREAELPARIVRLARQNLGQPYEIFLLGEFPFELHDPDPIYCLSRSDCLTFCEHTYALALARDWWTYLRGLQRLRYRDGVIGMLTRNHFTEADWNRNNTFLLADITATLRGGTAARPFRQKCRRADFFGRFGLGQDIPDEEFDDCFIPTAALPDILAELADADFVNIMRGTPEAPFCGHTGLITHGPDGTVNFLHSARPAVREQPLLEYLATDRRSIGVKILRLRPDAQARMDAELARPGPATPLDDQRFAAAVSRLPRPGAAGTAVEPVSWAAAMHTQAYRLTYDSPVDPELQAALAGLDERIGAALGIPTEDRAFGVLTVGDLRLALVRPDAMFYGASVPKICILLAYFDAHPEAATRLDPAVRSELERMIKLSDNELAAKYSQLVGLDAIQKLLQSEPYAFYDREHGGFWCGKHYGIAEPRMGDPVDDHSHAVTVRQCLRYYLMLEQGKLVSAAASATMQEIFAAPTLPHLDDGFVRGLHGRDVAILRKSGEWEEWHLDTARVQHGGRAYLLAGATRHARGEEYLAQMAAALDDLLCGPAPVPASQPKP